MIALLCFFLTLLVSPFKSKSRLDAEKRCAPRASDPLAGCTIDTLESSFQKRERDDGRQPCYPAREHVVPVANRDAAYYNESRIHRSLDKDAPFHRAIERFGVITSQPVLGGLHHQYCRI